MTAGTGESTSVSKAHKFESLIIATTLFRIATCHNITMASTPSNECILLNNRAVALFEKGALAEASGFFKRALGAFALKAPSEEMVNDEQMNDDSFSPKMQIHRWSQSVAIEQRKDVADKQEVFLHRRAAYLCETSFQLNMYHKYATFILYNVAVCIHIQSQTQNDCSLAEESLNRAFSLYSMAFSTMKLSTEKDGPLLAILFNNSGQLLYRQWRTFEAAKCFRVVQDLMATLPMDSFAPQDFNGLYLNSFMDSNTASAA
jgi:hypothetical protein